MGLILRNSGGFVRLRGYNSQLPLPSSYNYIYDNYPTNGVAAFSLKKVRSSYTGDAIRVRRSSDNAEQDIGFVGYNLNTSALETFCAGTDGYIAKVYNQTVFANWAGNTYPDIILNTAATQPKIVSNGLTIREPNNNQPAIQFDGLDDKLVSNTYDGTLNTRFETFSIISITSTARFVILSRDGDGVSYIYAGEDGSSNTTISNPVPINSLINGSTPTFVTRDNVYDNTPKNTVFSIYVYASNLRALTPNGYNGFLWAGYWQESIVYEAKDTQPTSTNAAAIDLLQRTNYNI